MERGNSCKKQLVIDIKKTSKSNKLSFLKRNTKMIYVRISTGERFYNQFSVKRWETSDQITNTAINK